MAFEVKNNMNVGNTLTSKRTIPSIANALPTWVTATPYIVGDYIEQSNKIYKCLTLHTAGTFATDLAANRWIEVSAGELGTRYSFTDQAAFEANAVNIYIKGDFIYIRNPRKLLRVTTGGTGFAGVVTEEFYNAFANRELSSGTQFAADFTPDRVLYGNFYYGGFTPGSGLTNINIADIQNDGGALIPATGEKLSFVLWNGKATAVTFTFDTNYFEQDGVTSTGVIALAAGETKFVEFEGHYGIPSTWRRVSTTASAIDTVLDFATLAALPATTGDLKLVTNEGGLSYLLRYSATDVYGLVPSSNTVQPGVELIAWVDTTDVVTTATPHGLSINDPFVFYPFVEPVSVMTPAPLKGVIYYIKTVPTPDTFTFSTTLGGATYDITNSIAGASATFIYSQGWWNVVDGGSQLPSEKQFFPRVVNQNNKSIEYNNANSWLLFDTDFDTYSYATTFNAGGVSTYNKPLQRLADLGGGAIIAQDNIALSQVIVAPQDNTLITPWIVGNISNVEKLGIYTYAGSPETFVTANLGATCFDTTNGFQYIKGLGTGNTGWVKVATTSFTSIVNGNYTVLESDDMIDLPAGATFTITIPANRKNPTIRFSTASLSATPPTISVSGVETIVDPSSYASVTSFVMPGTTALGSTISFQKVGTSWRFIA